MIFINWIWERTNLKLKKTCGRIKYFWLISFAWPLNVFLKMIFRDYEEFANRGFKFSTKKPLEDRF